MYQPLITFCPYSAIFTQVLTIFALRQELFDRNLPHIAEFVTVSKSLPRFLRNAYK